MPQALRPWRACVPRFVRELEVGGGSTTTTPPRNRLRPPCARIRTTRRWARGREGDGGRRPGGTYDRPQAEGVPRQTSRGVLGGGRTRRVLSPPPRTTVSSLPLAPPSCIKRIIKGYAPPPTSRTPPARPWRSWWAARRGRGPASWQSADKGARGGGEVCHCGVCAQLRPTPGSSLTAGPRIEPTALLRQQHSIDGTRTHLLGLVQPTLQRWVRHKQVFGKGEV